jgi:hypothetical protein
MNGLILVAVALSRASCSLSQSTFGSIKASSLASKIEMRVATSFPSPRAAKALSAPARDLKQRDMHALRRQVDRNRKLVRTGAEHDDSVTHTLLCPADVPNTVP